MRAIQAPLKTASQLKIKLLTAIVCAAVGCVLVLFPVGDPLVFFGYDLLAVLTPTGNSSDCVLVEMDEKSYQELNQDWGKKWDRDLHARLLAKLSQDRARLTIFDVTFFDSTLDEADRKLAEAIRANGKVVIAASLEPVSSQGVGESEVRQPLRLLATNAVGWGLAEVERDKDQTVRRHFSGTEHHASLAWTAANALGAAITKRPDARLEERWIGYYGPPQTIPSIRYSDALTAPESYFRDRIVFIGGRPKTRFVGDEVDEFSTPFTRWDGRSSGGVEVMATSVLNLVRGDWRTRSPWWLESLVVLCAGAALGFGLCSMRPLRAFLMGTGVAVIVFVLAAVVIWLWHIWFAWSVIAMAQVPLAWLISVAARKSQPADQKENQTDLPVEHRTPSESSVALPISSVTASNTVAAGAVVADHKLLRLIGEGGYGEVWLCENAVGMHRAAKIVYRAKFADERPYQREFQGVQNFMRLNHPTLLRVLHIGPNPPKDLFYYVMELGDDEQTGQPISPDKYVARTLASDLKCRGRLSVGECISLGLSIARGLEYLHSQSLIHRDIKPSNIIYVEGMAKLADVGLVADPETTDLSLVGTRGYMDPYFPSSLGSDIYGLGKVLYVAMTGLSPSQFPEIPADVPPASELREVDGLLKIISKACAASAAERYASITLMLADLEAVQKDIERQA